MRILGWATSLLLALCLALPIYIFTKPVHYPGNGSPVYPGNGPLPRGGGHYVVGQPYEVNGRWYSPAEQPDYDEVGIASWYGPQFDRHETANGEWFDMDYLTAAHTTLPLPSYVRVTNLENGRVLVVRVNDRGPFVGDRIIDLSRRAAETLSMKMKGTARVRVQYLGPAPLNDKGLDLAAMNRMSTDAPRIAERPATVKPRPVLADSSLITESFSQPSDNNRYIILVGSFSNVTNADRARSHFLELGPVEIKTIATESDILFQVRIGPLGGIDQATQAVRQVIEAGFRDATLVPLAKAL